MNIKSSSEDRIVELERNLNKLENKLNKQHNKDVRKEWLKLSKEHALIMKDVALANEEESVIEYYPNIVIGIEKRDIPLPHLIWRPEAAVAWPTLFQTQDALFLIFNAVCLRDEGGYSDFLCNESMERLVAIAVVKRCRRSEFGSPGGEELHTHPLYTKGRWKGSIFEVINSSWIHKFQEKENSTQAKRHFIILFRERSFECLADSLEIILSDEPSEKIRQFMGKEIPLILREDELSHLEQRDEDENLPEE